MGHRLSDWTATPMILHHGALCVNYCFALQTPLLAVLAITIVATVLGPAAPNIFGNPITIRGRISGFFMERTKEYYRRVEGSRHFLRKPPAITNDVDALAEAERLGADRVRIVDSETGIEYLCAILVIREYGFPIDRGYGKQIGLPFAYWVKTAPDGTITPPTLPKAVAPVAPVVEQPALFTYAEPVQRRGGAY